MSGTYINKALLFDEREIEAASGQKIETFAALCALATDYADDRQGYRETPFATFIGCSSERFGTTKLLDHDFDSCWTRDRQDWAQTVASVTKSLGGIDREVITRFLGTGDQDALIAEVAGLAASFLVSENFERARCLVTALENLRAAGLPCFRSPWYLTGGGEEDAYDMRRENHGVGRRVIVEMAFVWE